VSMPVPPQDISNNQTQRSVSDSSVRGPISLPHDRTLPTMLRVYGNVQTVRRCILTAGHRVQSQVEELALKSTIFWTLKMEATCSSETSVDSQRTTLHYIPEDRTLHNHRCENLKSYELQLDQNFRLFIRLSLANHYFAIAPS
jgi:hypothetical protein